ncbi:MAG: hypothetical protein NTY38_02115 [Acidobacteria bacterium]|nr:hypothetical protein [Acidobacteriota bacterium]
MGPSGGGMDEVRFVIPADAPRGCHVPLMVRLGGTHPSNWATLRVEPDPGMCENVDRARAALREGGRAGFVVPLHLAMRYQAEPHDRVDFTGDALIAGFRQGHDAAGVGRVLAVPEPGTCTVYTRSLDLAQLSSQLQGEILSKTKKLLGGTLELASGKEKRVVAAPGTEREIYYQTIGGEMPDMAARLPLFLRPGKLRVCSMGTAEVPALQFDLRIPEPVEWTSRDRTAAVDRGKELTIRWETKGRSQPVAIAGISIDKPARAAAAFLCLPERKRTSFRVPVEVLQSLPPSRTQFDQSMGFLFVATLPGLEPPMFNEGGLDALLATGLAVDGRSVQYR